MRTSFWLRAIAWGWVFAGFLPSAFSTEPAGPPLAIEEAIETALGHSPLTEAAKQARLSAESRVGVARSPWLPQVSFLANARGDASYPLGGETGKDIYSFRANGQLSLNQLVYDFGRLSGRLAAAQALAQAAQGDEQATRAQVVLSTVSGFFTVLQNEALVAVASENLQQQQRREKQSESFFKIGTKPQIDVLMAKTAVAQARLQVLQARGNAQVARTQFLQTLGLEQSEWAAWRNRPLQASQPTLGPLETAVYSQDVETVLVPEAFVEQALAARPDYKALAAKVRQAEAQLRAVSRDYWPSISLGATASLSSGTFGGVSGLDVTMQTLPGILLTGSASLSWPLFTGFSTVYGTRDARAQRDAAVANLQQLRLQVRSQLEQALQQVLTARLTVQAATAVAEQAQKQLDMPMGAIGPVSAMPSNWATHRWLPCRRWHSVFRQNLLWRSYG